MVLNEGKIHEIGKHEQLMKSNGIYQSFIELQVRGYPLLLLEVIHVSG